MHKIKAGILATILTVSFAGVGFTNVKEVLSYSGKGVKVAILDSGVEIDHTDLKKNIIGGYDFIENKAIYKDGDDRTAHGTHVAGIIAANGKITGVAKDASLLVYRVNSKNDSILEENIIKAIDKAIKDGANVINISLRTPNDSPNSKVQQAIKKAIDQGIIVVKANGNYGPENWTTRDLASSEDVISVGNSTTLTKEPILIDKNKNIKIKLQHIKGSNNFPEFKNLELLDLENISLKELEKENIKDKIILIRPIEYEQMIDIGKKAKTLGAKAVISIQSLSEIEFIQEIEEPNQSVPIVAISDEDAIKLHDSKIKEVSSTNQEVEGIYKQSSVGPTKGTWILKPDVSAPGTHILSTTSKLIDESAYRFNTGTSMSAPYVAGGVALIKEAHPDWTGDQIKAAIINNATVLKDRDGKPYSVLAQGAGRVDFGKSIGTKTFISPYNISFGLIENTSVQTSINKKISVQNIAETEKEYSVKIETTNKFDGVTIEIPNHIKVTAKATETIDMNLKIKANLKERGIVEGRMYFENSEDDADIKIVPFIILINPKDYPLVSGFKVKNQMISPNKDGFLDSTKINYYIPNNIKGLEIFAENINTAEKINIIENKDVKSGHYENTWNGENLNRKKISDGLYSIGIIASNEEWSTKLEGNEVMLIDTRAPIMSLKVKREEKVIKEIVGSVKDYLLENSYIIDKMNNQDNTKLRPVTLQYSIDNQKTWKDITINDQGNFKYNFEEQHLKTKFEKIYIKAVDAVGNTIIKMLSEQ